LEQVVAAVAVAVADVQAGEVDQRLECELACGLVADPGLVLPGAEDADEGGIRDADVVTRKGPAAGVAAGLWW
jgi:hypothetical protein